ncbi:hypothetical protein EDD16DRAFT_1521311 [Pisolithus croceorrhizus]|nr:hypothetical protein EDD16DRAFT_1521311 [Pisolithus croceorrhizus]KAI6131940.1 hypothetical protein EV401DRAFT_1883912 [Pisolithus croceorrhizus]KAI6162591.1 hypothetical protein EDD17DRAFT_1508016 [Pisolithus thermaeus]
MFKVSPSFSFFLTWYMCTICIAHFLPAVHCSTDNFLWWSKECQISSTIITSPLCQTQDDDGNGPLNIAELPQQLVTGDPHAQNNVHLTLYPHQAIPDINALRQLHDQGHAKTAISLLLTHHCLKIDQQYHVDTRGPDLIPQDLAVALMQPSPMSMDCHFWPYNAINVFPFDPKGRMMYLGT